MLVGRQLGPFAVEKEIGSGGMGTVYLARHGQTGQKVAIKVLAPGLVADATSLARFEREAAILKKLSHPNIVRLFATGKVQGTPFYVMEYVAGEPLETVLERRGRLTWEEVVALGKQLCAGLHHAHQAGVVHRDLKPANVMFTTEGTPKLTDFGIARGGDDAKLTATNAAIGTAAYMSPEQCRGERSITHKSDLYSLGVLFYQLLTGRLPFTADSTLDMFLAHTKQRPERVARLVLDIPVWLDALVSQLLEKDPDKRPFDAAVVGQALERVEEKVAAHKSVGVEVVSSPVIDLPPTRQRAAKEDMETARVLHEAVTKRKVRRKKKPVYERGWFVVLGVLAVLAGLAGVIWRVTRPEKPEVLFARAQALVQAKDEHADGALRTYLKAYGDRDDAPTRQARAWLDELDAETKEAQLRNRMRLNMSPDSDGERLAQSGWRNEENGDLAAARDRWQALAKDKASSDPNQHGWALLAEKHLHELDGVDAREKQLAAKLEAVRLRGEDAKPADEAEGQMVRATHFEVFGDLGMALDLWKRVKDSAKGDGGRAGLLLAAKKVHDLEGRAPHAAERKAARLKLLRGNLAEAETAAKDSKPEDARVICRDVLALYGKDDDADLAGPVAAARTLLARLPAEPKGEAGERS